MSGMSKCRFCLKPKYINKAVNLKIYKKLPLLFNAIFPIIFVSFNEVKNRWENGAELGDMILYVVWNGVSFYRI